MCSSAICPAGTYVGCSECPEPPCNETCIQGLSCQECNLDTYQPNSEPKENTKCLPCDSDKGTVSTGSESSEDCLSRFFLPAV